MALKDDTLAFTRSGEIILKSVENTFAKTTVSPESASLYWIRARVAESHYERPPRIAAIRPNTMRLTQMETVRNEVLGGSSGRRDQVFKIANAPILDGSLRLEIDQGSGFEASTIDMCTGMSSHQWLLAAEGVWAVVHLGGRRQGRRGS